MTQSFVFRFPYVETTPSQENTFRIMDRIGLKKELVLSYTVKWFLSIEGLYSTSAYFASDLIYEFENSFTTDMISIIENLEDSFRNCNDGIWYDNDGFPELLPLDSVSAVNSLLEFVKHSFRFSMESLMSLKYNLMVYGISVEAIDKSNVEVRILPGQNALDAIIRIS